MVYNAQTQRFFREKAMDDALWAAGFVLSLVGSALLRDIRDDLAGLTSQKACLREQAAGELDRDRKMIELVQTVREIGKQQWLAKRQEWRMAVMLYAGLMLLIFQLSRHTLS